MTEGERLVAYVDDLSEESRELFLRVTEGVAEVRKIDLAEAAQIVLEVFEYIDELDTELAAT